MLVRATKQGYFDLKRRAIGDEFEVAEKLFSDKWMEKVGGDGPKPVAQASKPVAPAKKGKNAQVI